MLNLIVHGVDRIPNDLDVALCVKNHPEERSERKRTRNHRGLDESDLARLMGPLRKEALR